MILEGVCYSALIQLCRVILSRMVEPYFSQSFLDEYCLMSNAFVSRRIDTPVFPHQCSAVDTIRSIHHVAQTLDLPSGEGVSTH